MGLSQTEVKDLKDKHGTLKTATVKDLQGVEQFFVFRRINREEMDAATKAGSASPTKALEIQMTSACVHGDAKLIMNDVEVFRSLAKVWGDIQKECEVTLGEL